jgi:hypothetical protein
MDHPGEVCKQLECLGLKLEELEGGGKVKGLIQEEMERWEKTTK